MAPQSQPRSWFEDQPATGADWFAENAPTPAPASVPAAAPMPSFGQRLARSFVESQRAGAEGVIGIAKGAGQTVVNLGKLAHQVPGLSQAIDAVVGGRKQWEEAFAQADAMLTPKSTAEAVGKIGEQIAEVAIPGGLIKKGATAAATKLAPLVGATAARVAGRVGAEAAAGAGLAAVQAGRFEAAPTGAVIGATVPVAGKVVERLGTKIASAAPGMVQAAIKPTVTAMRQEAGASTTGIAAKGRSLARWILQNRVTTPEKAETIIKQAERELQRVLSLRNAPTDAATRAQRYLEALQASAQKQGLGEDQVRQIGAQMRALLRGPMGEVVGYDQLGNPIRALRTGVPATEALESARASGRWSTRRTWGELKGAVQESKKAVERAQRDAVKAAVTEARPLLGVEAKAIQAKKVLDRMAFRQANRDVVGLGAHVIAAGEIARGRFPLRSILANWLRNNQLQAGIYADRLGKAIATGNMRQMTEIMDRIAAVHAGKAAVP